MGHFFDRFRRYILPDIQARTVMMPSFLSRDVTFFEEESLEDLCTVLDDNAIELADAVHKTQESERMPIIARLMTELVAHGNLRKAKLFFDQFLTDECVRPVELRHYLAQNEWMPTEMFDIVVGYRPIDLPSKPSEYLTSRAIRERFGINRTSGFAEDTSLSDM